MATAHAHEPRPGSRPFLVPEPLRAPVAPRMWREFAYLVLSLPISVLLFGYAVAMTAAGAGLLVTFLGVPVLAAALAGCRGFGILERHRARALLGLDVAEPAPARGAKPGVFSWMGAVLKSGVSWRHLLYALLHFPWAVFAFVTSVTFWCVSWSFFLYPLWRWVFVEISGDPRGISVYSDSRGGAFYLDTPFETAVTCAVGLLLVLVSPWLIRALTTMDRLLVRGLLGPSRLATRVDELESDRGAVVDTAAADLRRIERELHDGAQARLVALAMDLGTAKETLAKDPVAAAALVDEAHGEVKTALQELRNLARDIHPAVLTDRGLDAALSSVASRCAVPVTVEVHLPARPAAAIEGIAYATVSELLRNVSEHSGARRASVDVWRSEDRLLLHVADDGVGGAHAGGSGGLAGLTGRLAAVDGLLAIDSPASGPTAITAELPWRDRPLGDPLGDRL
ncbi:sensor domain-containing protein [Streptomyces sp. NPDC093085]|uniref:sensor histidine kinase n=1 Tax=Streptomyces sp. NPDC093085 TaxID=3155068 RepID=UPI00342A80E9